jgi:hypothetical protein
MVRRAGRELEIVKRDWEAEDFKVLPKRRIVERTFGWLRRIRRLSKDYERRVQTSENLVEVAMIRLMLKRLARGACASLARPVRASLLDLDGLQPGVRTPRVRFAGSAAAGRRPGHARANTRWVPPLRSSRWFPASERSSSPVDSRHRGLAL